MIIYGIYNGLLFISKEKLEIMVKLEKLFLCNICKKIIISNIFVFVKERYIKVKSLLNNF